MMSAKVTLPTLASSIAALLLVSALPACAQSAAAIETKPAAAPPASTAKAPAAASEPSRAVAYYHLALASVYEDDAISEGRSDEVNRAIEEYKLALNADSDSPELNNVTASAI